jgi:hypothetical protein
MHKHYCVQFLAMESFGLKLCMCATSQEIISGFSQFISEHNGPSKYQILLIMLGCFVSCMGCVYCSGLFHQSYFLFSCLKWQTWDNWLCCPATKWKNWILNQKLLQYQTASGLIKSDFEYYYFCWCYIRELHILVAFLNLPTTASPY